MARRDRITIFAVALICMAPTACNRSGKIIINSVPNPAPHGSTIPNITEAPDGNVVLSWLEPGQGGSALKFSFGDGNSWSEARSVVTRSNFTRYTEAPSWVLMLPNHSLVSVWSEEVPSGGKWPGDYLYAAVSSDHGKTWSKPIVIHGDRSISEHSFASLTALDDSHAQILWLDARDDASKHRYRLMSAVIDSSGSIGPEQTLDEDVCTCCPTTLVRTRDGVLAAYRNHTPDEVRDMYVIGRRQLEQWMPAHPIHDDNWRINACPVNGPSLAARGDQVVAAWFTGAQNKPTVLLAFSRDAGKTFGPPITVDSQDEKGRPVGKVAVSLLSSGEALLAWTASDSNQATLRAARVNEGSTKVHSHVIATSVAGALGYPHMRALTAGAIVTWGGSNDQKEIQTAVLRPPE